MHEIYVGRNAREALAVLDRKANTCVEMHLMLAKVRQWFAFTSIDMHQPASTNINFLCLDIYISTHSYSLLPPATPSVPLRSTSFLQKGIIGSCFAPEWIMC